VIKQPHEIGQQDGQEPQVDVKCEISSGAPLRFIFVHYADIETEDLEAFKRLQEGQSVEIDLEGPLSFEQDGFRYRALRVKPLL
jgi:hypothetical protein